MKITNYFKTPRHHSLKGLILLVMTLFLYHQGTAQQTNEEIVLEVLKKSDTLQKQNRMNEALSTIDKAIKMLDVYEIDVDTISQMSYLKKGQFLFKQQKFQASINSLKKGLKKSQKRTKWMGKILLNLGRANLFYGDLKQAQRYSEDYLQLVKELYKKPNSKLAMAYGTIGQIHLMGFRDYKNAKLYFEKSLEIVNLINNQSLKTKTIYFLGVIDQNLKNHDAAKKAYHQLLEILKDKPSADPNVLINVHMALGNVFLDERKLEKSIDYNKKALQIAQNSLQPTSLIFGDIYTSLGNVYKRNEENEKAIASYKKGLNIYKKTFKGYSPHSVAAHIGLCNAFSNLKDYPVALKYLDTTENVLKRNSIKDHALWTTKRSKARIYSGMKNYKKSSEVLKEALHLSTDLFGSSSSMTVSTYIDLSELMLLQEKFQLANNYLTHASKAFDKKVLFDQDFSKTKEPLNLLLFFDRKSKLFKALSKKNKVYKDSLAINYKNAIAFQDYIQANNVIAISKEIFLKDAFPVYENYIDFLHKEENTTSSHKAFEVSEKTKTRRLQEALNQVAIENLGKESDSLLHLEKAYNIDIAYYDKKKYELESDVKLKNDSLIDDYDTKLFDLKDKRENLQKLFKKDFPKYFNLKYNHDVTKVTAIQNHLKEKEAVLEFFVGDSSVFAFVITKDLYKASKIKKDFPLKEWVSNLRSGIQDYWIKEGQSDEVLQEKNKVYAAAAYNLYDKLLAPITQWLPEKVIIIPDGELFFVPFDALLTKKLETIDNTTKVPYLLNDYQISYNYSATLYERLLEKKESNAEKKILAFAPSFKASDSTQFTTIRSIREGLFPLKYNIDEAKALADIYDTEIREGTAAQKSVFLNEASNYKVLHLSTHAKSNDKLGDYSFIAFSAHDSIPEPEKLYVRELYNLNLNAEMVVLSACETGLGELQKGEGVIGLGRAFTYAGARSTVTSLWNVNDAQTAKLMKLFYQNLKKKIPKDEALRQAKLTYINSENLTAPYFWAAFVPSGDMRPLELSNNRVYYYLLLGGILLIIVLGIYVYKKRDTN